MLSIRSPVAEAITDLRDTSSKKNGVCITIEVAKNAMAQVVLNQIYTHTMFETSLGCTMLVVDHNRPRTMNLVQVLQAYIDHRLEVIVRRTVFEVKKAEARVHILEGLIKALDITQGFLACQDWLLLKLQFLRVTLHSYCSLITLLECK